MPTAPMPGASPPQAAPAAQPMPGIPQAGTPEMDQFIQHINLNPAVMQQLPPQAIAEVLKHLGLDKSDVEEVGQWMDDAADKVSGVPSDVADGTEEDENTVDVNEPTEEA